MDGKLDTPLPIKSVHLSLSPNGLPTSCSKLFLDFPSFVLSFARHYETYTVLDGAPSFSIIHRIICN
jgi:hypothetical protein